jgi:hypothetical protein
VYYPIYIGYLHSESAWFTTVVSELQFFIPAFGQSLYQTLSEPAFGQPTSFRVSLIFSRSLTTPAFCHFKVYAEKTFHCHLIK